MNKTTHQRGDPYEVGYTKPPKRTRFKKGQSGNSSGRPKKPPDPYTELMRVLQEKVTATLDGEPEKVTVQQALLMRLRDEAIKGKPWAEKLVLKILKAMPADMHRSSAIEQELHLFRAKARLELILEGSDQSEPGPDSDTLDDEDER